MGNTIGTDADILMAVSTDNGLHWSKPSPLHDAATDASHDDMPSIAADPSGAWVVVWVSDNSFGGTTGADFDIVASFAPSSESASRVEDAALGSVTLSAGSGQEDR